MIRAADLNSDGKLDAVFVSPQGNLAPTVLLNTGNDVNGVPQFTVTTYTPVYSGLRSVTVGDLNGDGKPDFIVGNAFGFLQVYLNNGDGTFSAGQTTYIQPNVGGSVGPGVIADLNDDGNADYVVTSNQSGATDIFFGNGDGTFQTTPLILPNYANSIAVADVNGDGKLDLLEVVYGTPNQLMVYLNQGGGLFSAPTLYSTGGTSSGWTAVATADMNGDGKLDVVVTNSQSNNVAVFLGDGSGTFGAPALFTVNLTPLDVAVGDFNGDGKPDVATVGGGGYGGNTYGVLLNTTVSALPPPVITSPTTASAGYGTAFSYTITATNAPTSYEAAPLLPGLAFNSSTDVISGTLPNTLGLYNIILSATNASGTGIGSLALTIIDPASPTIASFTPSITSIWPPNKKMVPITLSASGANLGHNVVFKITSVTTNEPDRNTQWQITGPLTLNLLADRLGTGTGRIYTITVVATDAAGSTSTKTCTVTVPHDQGH